MWWNTLFVVLAIFGSGESSEHEYQFSIPGGSYTLNLGNTGQGEPTKEYEYSIPGYSLTLGGKGDTGGNGGLGVNGKLGLNGGLKGSLSLKGGLGGGGLPKGGVDGKISGGPGVSGEVSGKAGGSGPATGGIINGQQLQNMLNDLKKGITETKNVNGQIKLTFSIPTLLDVYRIEGVPPPQSLLDDKNSKKSYTVNLDDLLKYLQSYKLPSTVSRTSLDAALDNLGGKVTKNNGQDILNINYSTLVRLLNLFGVPPSVLPTGSNAPNNNAIYQIPVNTLLSLLNSKGITNPNAITTLLTKHVNPESVKPGSITNPSVNPGSITNPSVNPGSITKPSVNPGSITNPTGGNNPNPTQGTLLVTLNGIPGAKISKNPQGQSTVNISIPGLIDLFNKFNIPVPKNILQKKDTDTTATFSLDQLLDYLKSEKESANTPKKISNTQLQNVLGLIPGASLVPDALGQKSLNINFPAFVDVLRKLGIPTKGVPQVSGNNSYQIPVPDLLKFLNNHNILSPEMITKFLDKFAKPTDSTPKPTPKPTENSILTYIKSLPGVTTVTNDDGNHYVRIPNASLVEAYKKYNIPIPKYMLDPKSRIVYSYLVSNLINFIERYTDTGNDQNPNALTKMALETTIGNIPSSKITRDAKGQSFVNINLPALIKLFKTIGISVSNLPSDLGDGNYSIPLNVLLRLCNNNTDFDFPKLISYLKQYKSQTNGENTPSPKVTKSPSTVSNTKLHKVLGLIPGANLVPNAKGEDSLNINFPGFVDLLGKLGIPTKGVPQVSGKNSYKIPVPLLKKFLNKHNILSPEMITKFLDKFANPGDSTPKPTPKPTETSILDYIKSLPGVKLKTNKNGKLYVTIPNASVVEAYKKYNIPVSKDMMNPKNRVDYTYLVSYLINFIEKFTDTGNPQNPNEISIFTLEQAIGIGKITRDDKGQRIVDINLPTLIKLFKTLGIPVSKLPSDLGDGEYKIPLNVLLRLCNHNIDLDFPKLISYLKKFKQGGPSSKKDSHSHGSGHSNSEINHSGSSVGSGSTSDNSNSHSGSAVSESNFGSGSNSDSNLSGSNSGSSGSDVSGIHSGSSGSDVSGINSGSSGSDVSGIHSGSSGSGGDGGSGESDDDGCGGIAGAANGARNLGNGLLDGANGVVTGALNYVPFVGGLGKKAEDLKTNALKGGLNAAGGKLLGGDKCKNKK